VLAAAFDGRDAMDKADIPYLLAMLDEKRIDADMELVAAESTFNAMEAFYKGRHSDTSVYYSLNSSL
jgi:hypothetical protein